MRNEFSKPKIFNLKNTKRIIEATNSLESVNKIVLLMCTRCKEIIS